MFRAASAPHWPGIAKAVQWVSAACCRWLTTSPEAADEQLHIHKLITNPYGRLTGTN